MRRLRVPASSADPPGGAGAPPGDTTIPRQELADSEGEKPSLESAARRRNENAAMARQEAPRAPQGARAQRTGSAAWRAIPLACPAGDIVQNPAEQRGAATNPRAPKFPHRKDTE